MPRLLNPEFIQRNFLARCFGKTTTNHLPGWFDKGASSNQLEARPEGKEIYELQIDDVKPECWKKYIKHQGELKSLRADNGLDHEVLNSWKYLAGDKSSRAVHLIKYPKGWSSIDNNYAKIKSDSKFEDIDDYGNTLITNQTTELLKNYRFWPAPKSFTDIDSNSVYEISSYVLKPGSMYDWTNYWARGLKCRQSVREDLAYAGMFTQIGHLHTIYHIWQYKDLKDRSKCRKLTWEQKDWDEVVAETGALVTTMKSGIIVPITIN